MELGTNSRNKTVIGLCYKRPTASYEEVKSLFATIREYMFSLSLGLLMGDFNFSGIDWITMHSNSIVETEFLEVIKDMYLYQHVTAPTRESNILDLVFSTEYDMIENLEVISPIANSDHNSIEFTLKISSDLKKVSTLKLQYNYFKGNYKDMICDLKSKNWNEEFENKTVEEKWESLKVHIENGIKKYIPLKKGEVKKKSPWMKMGIIKKIKKRNKKWQQYSFNPDFNRLNEYKQERNIVTASIRRAKFEYESSLADKIQSDSKSFYSYVKSKSKTKPTIGPLKDKNGVLTINEKEIGDVLNNHFSSVFTKENYSNIPIANTSKDMYKRNSSKLVEISITSTKVREAIHKLKMNKSPGIDDLNSTLIKNCEDGLVDPLTELYKSSLEGCVIPDDWKKANVIALFKKGSKQDPGNYRPVSLTCHCCKMLEHIIKQEIVIYLENNNIINNSQHGFRKGRSCLTNLLEFVEYVANYIDKGEPVDVIYLDFQKAFDKVPHGRLVSKLQAVGIDGNVLLWIKEWLRNRWQRVTLYDTCTDWKEVSSGVPQGSVLGPILFTVYINDIDDNISSKILKFADDTKLIRNVGNVMDISILRDDLNRMVKW